MKRGAARFVIPVVVLAVVAAAVAAVVVNALTESKSSDLTPVESRSLVQRVVKGARLAFTKKPPQRSRTERLEQFAQEANEGVGPREQEARGADELKFSSVSATRPAAPGELVLFTNTMAFRNVPGITVAPVTEPSVAMDGRRVLLTWNWGAAASEDGGRTFPRYLNPNRTFSDEHLFCCDQLAYHVPGTESRPELWLWVVQSEPEIARKLRFDQAVRVQGLVGSSLFELTTFPVLEFSARSLSGLDPARYWLDQPRIAATREHVFFAVNAYQSGGKRNDYYASYVIRVSADDLARARFPVREEIVRVGSREEGLAGFVGFSNGATDTMYFAGQVSRSTLRVWKWTDNSKDPEGRTDVEHGADAGQHAFDCRRSAAPASVNWCGRKPNGARVLTGWVAKGIVGFAWNAPANPEAGFRYPYIHVVQLDEGSLKLHDEPSIRFERTAVNYAALVPNGRGEVGGVVLLGGEDSFEKCAAVTRNPRADGSVGWASKIVDASNTDPEKPSGDYLGATTTRPAGNVWAAACMTFHDSGHPAQDHFAQVHFATFGRAEDRPR